jgi:hypothetical protein
LVDSLLTVWATNGHIDMLVYSNDYCQVDSRESIGIVLLNHEL